MIDIIIILCVLSLIPTVMLGTLAIERTKKMRLFRENEYFHAYVVKSSKRNKYRIRICLVNGCSVDYLDPWSPFNKGVWQSFSFEKAVVLAKQENDDHKRGKPLPETWNAVGTDQVQQHQGDYIIPKLTDTDAEAEKMFDMLDVKLPMDQHGKI